MDIENWLDEVAQIDGIRFIPGGQRNWY